MDAKKYYENFIATNSSRVLDSELFDRLICNKLIKLDDEILCIKLPYRTSSKIVTTNLYEKINDYIDILVINIDFTCDQNIINYLKYITAASTVAIAPSINLGFADPANVSSFLITDISILEDTVKHTLPNNNQVTFNTNTVRIKGYTAVKNPFKEPE